MVAASSAAAAAAVAAAADAEDLPLKYQAVAPCSPPAVAVAAAVSPLHYNQHLQAAVAAATADAGGNQKLILQAVWLQHVDAYVLLL